MSPKKDHSLNRYLKIGAKARLLKRVLSEFLLEIQHVMYADEYHKLCKVEDVISSVISKTEDKMFSKHPDISNDYLRAFYGSLDEDPMNPVDEEVIGIARKTVDKILGINRHKSICMTLADIFRKEVWILSYSYKQNCFDRTPLKPFLNMTGNNVSIHNAIDYTPICIGSIYECESEEKRVRNLFKERGIAIDNETTCCGGKLDD